ncbi:MAG: Holliday junction branch migration protein RuvA [Bacteroidales bacterium]
MFDYISGEIVSLHPTELTLDNCGIGYKILITLNGYSKLSLNSNVKLYIYHHLRENIELLYGFIEEEERKIFTHLNEVSGIGPNTARMMLSSMSSDELIGAIAAGDVNKLKSIKGIGLKTAQRLLIELKDKIGKEIASTSKGTPIVDSSVLSQAWEEAHSALVLLGFGKSNVERVLNKLLREQSDYSVEELIKRALKEL